MVVLCVNYSASGAWAVLKSPPEAILLYKLSFQQYDKPLNLREQASILLQQGTYSQGLEKGHNDLSKELSKPCHFCLELNDTSP